MFSVFTPPLASLRLANLGLMSRLAIFVTISISNLPLVHYVITSLSVPPIDDDAINRLLLSFFGTLAMIEFCAELQVDCSQADKPKYSSKKKLLTF